MRRPLSCSKRKNISLARAKRSANAPLPNPTLSSWHTPRLPRCGRYEFPGSTFQLPVGRERDEPSRSERTRVCIKVLKAVDFSRSSTAHSRGMAKQGCRARRSRLAAHPPLQYLDQRPHEVSGDRRRLEEGSFVHSFFPGEFLLTLREIPLGRHTVCRNENSSSLCTYILSAMYVAGQVVSRFPYIPIPSFSHCPSTRFKM